MSISNHATLAGKRALVTGGTRGIGAAIVRRFAAEGEHVAFTYQASHDRAEALAAELTEDGTTVIALQADAGNLDDATHAVKRAAAELGGLDILVHNAGVSAFAPFGEAGHDELRRQFAVNVDGVQATTLAAAPYLPDGGRIIIIGSITGERALTPGSSIYTASKHAVAGLAKGWARDLAPRNILVNVIQPGPIDTDMNPTNEEIAAAIRQMIPLGRFGEAAEIAGVAAFLAGPDATFITGATLNIDGGVTA